MSSVAGKRRPAVLWDGVQTERVLVWCEVQGGGGEVATQPHALSLPHPHQHMVSNTVSRTSETHTLQEAIKVDRNISVCFDDFPFPSRIIFIEIFDILIILCQVLPSGARTETEEWEFESYPEVDWKEGDEVIPILLSDQTHLGRRGGGNSCRGADIQSAGDPTQCLPLLPPAQPPHRERRAGSSSPAWSPWLGPWSRCGTRFPPGTRPWCGSASTHSQIRGEPLLGKYNDGLTSPLRSR